MIHRRPLLAAFASAVLLLVSAPHAAVADQPIIFAEHGRAIGGYDTVAYFTDGQPVRGDIRYSVMWKGAVWLFANPENRDRFEANPRAFAPRYGGYCAYGMARGKAIGSAPDAWAIRDGRLYLIHNRDLAEQWQQDAPAEIAQANANWPAALRD